MNNIKSIGGAGGIFHIFVPGVFLLLNFIGSVYLFPLTSEGTKKQILDLFGNSALSILITISFGYLIGVILRIFQSESADRWSAKYLRCFDKTARKGKCEKNLYAYERFPYSEWMDKRCERLPEDVQKFYREGWPDRATKTFINFCKLQIISEDERAANEIYAAEALCRYISGMLYALLIASILLSSVVVSNFLLTQSIHAFLLTLILSYGVAILGILRNFRFIRIKEVQTIFYASYKNRHLFL